MLPSVLGEEIRQTDIRIKKNTERSMVLKAKLEENKALLKKAHEEHEKLDGELAEVTPPRRPRVGSLTSHFITPPTSHAWV